METVTRTEFEELKDRVKELEKENTDSKLTQTRSEFELKELIKSAVEEGNAKIMSLMEEHNVRICKLEHQDGEKAKAIIKAIIATSLSWLILGILNNLPVLVNK